MEAAVITNEYIPGDETSFTIIAFRCRRSVAAVTVNGMPRVPVSVSKDIRGDYRDQHAGL